MAPHPDLVAEQAHIERAYQRLAQMRAAAAEAVRSALTHTSGAVHQTRVERDVMVQTSSARQGRLELGTESLCFGRIDRTNGETFYIGRLAVADEDHEPLVIDWRAPAAEAFYRATGAQPLDLWRRRHFLTEGRRLLDIEDELFATSDEEEAGSVNGRSSLGGSGALLAALARARSGRMRDIVATVQKEQDEIIRAPLAGVLIVDGGPGTGKTAVALHRAAYLLYTYRFPLERQGVLVVGPNPLFLRYIEQVLPSLGENGVEMTTPAGLETGMQGKANGSESVATAHLKGDARMAKMLAKAVADRQRPLRKTIVVGYGAIELRITPSMTAEVVAEAKRRPGAHNERRALVERLLFRRLHQHLLRAQRRRTWRSNARGSPSPHRLALLGDGVDGNQISSEELTPDELALELRRHPAMREVLERIWPVLTPQHLLHDLFGASSLISLAGGGGLLSPEEKRALHRPRSASVEDVAWTPADLALLNEARALLGQPRRNRPPVTNGTDAIEEREGMGTGDPDELRSYGHIVVDEVQDLSPMQLRMLTRRSLNGSMTLVGDLAQATGVWAPGGWHEVLAHLPARQGARVSTLSVNYRTPTEIMEVANQVLTAALPHARPPQSVRDTGERPVVVPTTPTHRGADVARMAAEQVPDGEGTVAVVCPVSLSDELATALDAAGVNYGHPGHRGLDTPVTLVPVEVVKGLEFDSVVVVEPALLVRESTQGLRALYVALTRATQRLTIVHAEPLPPELMSPLLDHRPVS